MNLRSTAFLFALMFSMLWLFGLMLAFKKNPLDQAYVVPTLQAARDYDVVSVVVQRRPKEKDPQEFVFTQDNDVWRLKDAGSNIAVKVEGFRINEIVNQIKSARKDDEFGVSSDLDRFGLTAPQATITIKGQLKAKTSGAKDDAKDKKDEKKEAAPAKEQEWKFFLGNDSADKKFVYVNSSDDPKRVFAVTKTSLDSLFFEDANALRSKRLFDFTDATAKLVEIKQNSTALELTKGDDGQWRFVKPGLGFADFEGPPAPKESKASAKTSEGGVKGLLNAIGAIRVDADADFVPAAKDNLSKYKLEDGKEKMRIQVGTADFKKEITKETLLIGEQEREYYYARLANDEGVFKLKAKALEPVLKALTNPGSLRSLDVAQFDPKTVDVVTLRLGKDETKLWKPEGKSWQIKIGNDPAKKANDKAVEKLIETLQGKRQIQRFHDVSAAEAKKLDAELGLDSSAVEVSVYSEGLAKKEDAKDGKKENEKDKDKDKDKDKKPGDGFELKKDAKPSLTLRFGKADKETVAVLRGTDSRFVVAKAILDAVAPAEGAIALLDPALPPFDTPEIVRLEIQRGAKKVELERGSGNHLGRWMVQEGKDKADHNLADDNRTSFVFKTMGGLAAKKWLKRIDPKDSLDEYGLKSPTLTVTVKKLRVTPATAAGLLAMLGEPAQIRPLVAGAALAGVYGGHGETVTIQFGKETADKDIYARHSGSDLLFAAPADLVKMLRELDLRDKTVLMVTEPVLGAGAIGAVAAQPLAGLAALTPVNSGFITDIDPAKIKEIRIAVRNSFELRELAFQRKDKSWVDASGLKDFNLDADKVEQLAKEFAHLRADRFISLAGGPKADQKLSAKDFLAKVDLITDERTITISIGATLDRGGHFAHASHWNDAIFLLQPTRIDSILRGVGHFAKERQAAE